MSATQQVIKHHEKTSLVIKFAGKYNIDPDKLLTTLKNTAFNLGKDKEITNEQMSALLIVSDQYGLNPFTREIFAFPDKNGGVVPMVGLDGWARIINQHAQFDGMEFKDVGSVEEREEDAKPCPEGIECIIYRKDRAHPSKVTEWFAECYQPPKGQYKTAGHWQSHTRRALRHKAMIQCARLAFGFVGIYDEDEGHRIIDAEVVEISTTHAQDGTAAAVNDAIRSVPDAIEDATIVGSEKPTERTVTKADLLAQIAAATNQETLDAIRKSIKLHLEGDDAKEVSKAMVARFEALVAPPK